jgi:23S rRNA (guanosine2251-2'-O)-methyltransferase
MLIYGIKPILEAFRAGRVSGLRVSERGGTRLTDVLKAAAEAGVPVKRVSVSELDRVTRGGVHQGAVADIAVSSGATLEGLLAGAGPAPLIVVLDGVEDPHNVGAILRTVDAAGATGVVRQSRHAAPLGGATAKASAGAAAHVQVADVVNIARALEQLKASGVWTVGLAGDSGKRYDEIDWTLPSAVVVGAEGHGLRRLVRERCDWLVSIPMSGHVQSLNVSVATGVALFEAVRQRKSYREPGGPGRRVSSALEDA